MTRECVTHHHACDCREAEFAAIKAERDDLHEKWADAEAGCVTLKAVLRERDALRAEVDRRFGIGGDLIIARRERDALQAKITDAPAVNMKQLAAGIRPGDYAVQWDWNGDGAWVALVRVVR